MNKHFTEIEVSSLEDIKEKLAKNKADNKSWFVFRGQTDSAWEPKTSLDRFLKCIIDKENQFKVEPYLLEEFQRRYLNYSHKIPEKYNRIEWWSLMQHYGAPTRLLDWTYSIYVAVFFCTRRFRKNKREERSSRVGD